MPSHWLFLLYEGLETLKLTLVTIKGNLTLIKREQWRLLSSLLTTLNNSLQTSLETIFRLAQAFDWSQNNCGEIHISQGLVRSFPSLSHYSLFAIIYLFLWLFFICKQCFTFPFKVKPVRQVPRIASHWARLWPVE